MKKIILINSVSIFIVLTFCLIIFSCSKNDEVSNTKKKKQEDFNNVMVVRGQFIFGKKCMKCHEMEVKLKGPALKM